MIRSLSTAVTGLRGHQTKLDIVGNNIANVNTVAFKKSQIRFEDLLSQTIQGATAPSQRGGINPSQVGMGMRISGVIDNHFQGPVTNTDRRQTWPSRAPVISWFPTETRSMLYPGRFFRARCQR